MLLLCFDWKGVINWFSGRCASLSCSSFFSPPRRSCNSPQLILLVRPSAQLGHLPRRRWACAINDGKEMVRFSFDFLRCNSFLSCETWSEWITKWIYFHVIVLKRLVNSMCRRARRVAHIHGAAGALDGFRGFALPKQLFRQKKTRILKIWKWENVILPTRVFECLDYLQHVKPFVPQI